MNRIDFLHSISYKDFVSSVTKFFDENMILYDAIGAGMKNESDVSISGSNTDDSIVFELVFKNKYDAIYSDMALKGRDIQLYGNEFRVIANIDPNDRCRMVANIIKINKKIQDVG